MVDLLQTHLQDVLQDVKLLGRLVDPNGPASDLAAVQHQVIVLAPDLNTPRRLQCFVNITAGRGALGKGGDYLLWFRVQQMGVLRMGSGERMMSCLQLLRFLFAGQKEREVHHPQKVED